MNNLNNSNPSTFTGNKALDINEPLLFEIGNNSDSGVDFSGFPLDNFSAEFLGSLHREDVISLPALSEPEAMRHYVRLSRKNYAIDMGIFPLGSCTMKHNPRINEKVARLPGFADIHPLQPQKTVQGALQLISELSYWLKEITGMAAVAMSPKAGAHGELCGMMAIHAALGAKGEKRTKVLVPESAHGTNPATAAYLGYKIATIPANEFGIVDASAVAEHLDNDVAAIMLTNPNTCGLFEKDIKEIADMVHGVGGYFYCDGANLNAIIGRIRPGDLGVDAMHINLHKTFSTPHGGGGPGAGPVVLSEALAPYAPVPFVLKDGDCYKLIENSSEVEASSSIGRMTAFHGQMGMFVRAFSFALSHGIDGLRQVSGDAVLSANYLRESLKDTMSLPYDNNYCMHEVLFNDEFLKDTGVSTLDFAKALIDEGFHPMTVYFPLVVHGAMLVEPTESESKHSLDQFITTMRSLAGAANKGDIDRFKQAPKYTPCGRLDETLAARKPILNWYNTEK